MPKRKAEIDSKRGLIALMCEFGDKTEGAFNWLQLTLKAWNNQ